MFPSWGIIPSMDIRDPSIRGTFMSGAHAVGRRFEYTYLAATLFGNVPINELPLLDVKITWNINDPGTLSASLNISSFAEEHHYFEATEPTKTVLYVLRDDVPIWGGIIWKRSFDSASRSLRIEAETWDSYMKRRILADSIYIQKDPPGIPNPKHFGVEQIEIFRQVWRFMEKSEGSDIGIVFGNQSSPVTRGVQFIGYQYEFFYKWLKDELAELYNGFEWFGTVGFSDDGKTIERRIEFGYPKFGRTWEETGIIWEYPGGIVKYEWSTNPDECATVVYVTGPGEAEKKVVKSVSNKEAHNDGYPRMDAKKDHAKQPDAAALLSHAAKYLYAWQPPGASIDVSTHPTVPVGLGSYFIGDEVRFVIKDDLFVNAMIPSRDMVGRIMGLSLTVQDSGHEEVKPTFKLASRYLDIRDPDEESSDEVPPDWNGLTIVPPDDFPFDPTEPDVARVPGVIGRSRSHRDDRGYRSAANAARYNEDPWGGSIE
jgi:hypothetical protein